MTCGPGYLGAVFTVPRVGRALLLLCFCFIRVLRFRCVQSIGSPPCFVHVPLPTAGISRLICPGCPGCCASLICHGTTCAW